MVEETDMRLAEEARLREEKAKAKENEQKGILKKKEENSEQQAGTAEDSTADAEASKRTGTETKETFALSKTGKVKKSK